MAYLTNAQLILITGTTLATNILDAIIDEADGDIKARIRAAGLTPPATDDDLTAASKKLSKAGIITHNRMTGTQTKSVKVGDITIQDDPDAAIAALTEAAWGNVDAYIAYTKGTISIPTMAIVGRQGQRIGEHEEMTDAEEADY